MTSLQGGGARATLSTPTRRSCRRTGRWHRSLLVVALPFAIAVAAPASAQAGGPAPIRHVWVINEENGQVCRNPDNTIYSVAFPGLTGCPLPGFPPYLGQVLPAEGTLVENYFGIGHESLDNYIAEISGQAPNGDTQADCPEPADLTPGTADAPQQQAIGQGCTYPARVKTIADQLQAKGLTWKGYEEDMGLNQAKDATGPTKVARSGTDCSFSNNPYDGNVDRYASKHNPFMWFHSLIDDQAYCDAHVVPLTELQPDLQRVETTPSLSFISPNMNDDGHDRQSGAVSAWAAYWVRQIMASPAYRQDGMIVIVYDENGDSGLGGVPVSGELMTSCCGEIPGPNSPSPGAFGSQGGGETGAWIVTPYGTPGTLDAANSYNHYSLLRSLEDVFGITAGGADGQGHLGYAAGNGVAPNADVGFRSFGCDDIFTTTCPPMATQVKAQPAPKPSSNVGPRRPDGSTQWLNPSPQGNDLNGISCATTAGCVAVGATGAIVSTADGGSSWTSRGSGTSSDLEGVSCPAGSQVCEAVGAHGTILGSGDGGQSWSAQASGTQQDLSGVTCPTASVCYAVGAYGAILGTTDGGQSWSTQSSQTTRDLAQIACPDASHCYVTGDFQASHASVLDTGALDHPTARRDILATGDGGQTWSSKVPAPGDSRYRGIACTDLDHCVVGDEGGSTLSTDNRFDSATSRDSAQLRLLGASCGGGGTCVLVGDFGSIVRTSAGKLAGRQTLPSGADLASVSCPSADACYAVGRDGVIMTSADGGASWATSGRDVAASNLLAGLPAVQGGTTIGSLGLAAESCPSATACVAVGSLGAILTSADAGASWSARGGLGAPGRDPFNLPIGVYEQYGGTPAYIPESQDAHPLDAVSCSSATTCVAVGELGKVMTTSNLDGGGGIWSARSSNTSNRLTGVSCPPGSSTCFAVGDYGTILKSADSGSSWSAQRLKGRVRSAFLNGVSCADARHCVAVGVQGLILTTADGSSWTQVSAPTSAYLSAVSCPSTSACAVVGSAGVVLATGNGGSSWSTRSAPSGDDLYSVSCATAAACAVSGSGGSVATTSDGGQSWTLKGTGTTDVLRGVTCPSQGSCYAAGDSGALLGITP